MDNLNQFCCSNCTFLIVGTNGKRYDENAFYGCMATGELVMCTDVACPKFKMYTKEENF